MSTRKLGLLIGTAWLLLVAACSDENTPATTSTPGLGMVTVEGEVTEKDDQVPVDGGVRMVLKLDHGDNEVLLFGSLFTEPPPTQERLDLYAVLVAVTVGDRVRATGHRVEGAITLEDLTILQQR